MNNVIAVPVNTDITIAAALSILLIFIWFVWEMYRLELQPSCEKAVKVKNE